MEYTSWREPNENDLSKMIVMIVDEGGRIQRSKGITLEHMLE